MPQFAFEDDTPVAGTQRKHRRSGRVAGSAPEHGDGGGNNDGGSVAGSLSYSATSSIQSNGSAAGESTDSSIGDILHVLDLDSENAELAAIMAKEGVGNPRALAAVNGQERRGSGGGGGRCQRGGGGGAAATMLHQRVTSDASSSLQYSEDGDSYYRGEGGVAAVMAAARARVPQTITGQPTDSAAPDLGGLGAAPYPTGGGRRGSRGSVSTSGSSDSERVRKGSQSSAGTPPTSPPPRARRRSKVSGKDGAALMRDGEAWYSKWWMCGFSDALTDFGMDSK